VTDSGKAVFLSYASQDANAAQNLCSALRAAGIEVWFDQSELRGGDAWDASIRRQIKSCALFLPVISRNTHDRDEGYFRLEWKLAVDRCHLMAADKAFLLPVVIDDTPDDDGRVPDRFREVQWTRLPGGKNADAFVDHVRRLLSSGPTMPDATSPRSSALSTSWTFAKSDRSISSASRSLVPWIAGAVVLAAIAYLVADRFWLSRRSTVERPATVAVPTAAAFNPPAQSIAVLPFVNMSGDPRQDYFSDGISEELLDSLSRLEELQVAARTSSFSFKGQNTDIATIARKLNVGAILEGSVRRGGNKVRVTVQLINAVTGFHMWSQTYDRQLTDILKVQTELATAVAQQLEVKLAGSEAARLKMGGTSNPVAYDAYLRGVQLRLAASSNQSEAIARAALAEFDRAVALDPEYSGAHAKRAQGLMQVAFYEHDVSARNRELVEAIQAAQRAVALAPNLGEAHLALGLALARGQLDVGRAAPEMDRALSLAPGSAEVQGSFADFANDMRHFASALQAARQAVRLDPRNVALHITLIDILTTQHKYDDALSALRIASEVEPASPLLAGSKANVLIASGQIAQALEWCESTSTPLDNWARSACLALAYHASGRRDDAERELNTFKAIDGETSAVFYAGTYAQWGERSSALEWLKKAERLRDPMLTELRADWEFDPLRDDPEFKAIEARMNFPP